MTLLEVKALKKTYNTRLGGHLVPALTNVTFSVEKGEYLAIMGESGSGKDHTAEHCGFFGSAHWRSGSSGGKGYWKNPGA